MFGVPERKKEKKTLKPGACGGSFQLGNGERRMKGYPRLHREFQASLHYMLSLSKSLCNNPSASIRVSDLNMLGDLTNV